MAGEPNGETHANYYSKVKKKLNLFNRTSSSICQKMSSTHLKKYIKPLKPLSFPKQTQSKSKYVFKQAKCILRENKTLEAFVQFRKHRTKAKYVFKQAKCRCWREFTAQTRSIYHHTLFERKYKPWRRAEYSLFLQLFFTIDDSLPAVLKFLEPSVKFLPLCKTILRLRPPCSNLPYKLSKMPSITNYSLSTLFQPWSQCSQMTFSKIRTNTVGKIRTD